MAAPEYVPVKPMDDVRAYESPPRRPGPWMPRRPGDLTERQPFGEHYGVPGPDQGYALKLTHLFEGAVQLGAVHWPDAVAGCVGVALKRAASYGRAPVVDDVRAAFVVWGFLDASPPPQLVELRERAFQEVANPHNWVECRRVVDTVRDEALRKPVAEIEQDYAALWKDLLDWDLLQLAADL